MNNQNLKDAVLKKATEKLNPAGEKYLSLSLAATAELARLGNIAGRIVELAALEVKVVPERYQRNMGSIGFEGQKKLLTASVGIVGAGGLGGFVLELLARMGVGKLVVIDGDVFSESNLNRQLLATETAMGKAKTSQAAKRISDLNSSLDVDAYHCLGDRNNMKTIFSDCNLVIDCLDNLPSRFDLEAVCGQLNIPMIHGAIAGFIGQLAVIRPKQPVLSNIYGSINDSGAKQGIEVQLGNPAYTPAMLGSYQAAEAVKILAGLEGVLPSGKMLIIDMQSCSSYLVDING